VGAARDVERVTETNQSLVVPRTDALGAGQICTAVHRAFGSPLGAYAVGWAGNSGSTQPAKVHLAVPVGVIRPLAAPDAASALRSDEERVAVLLGPAIVRTTHPLDVGGSVAALDYAGTLCHVGHLPSVVFGRGRRGQPPASPRYHSPVMNLIPLRSSPATGSPGH